jgi:hypothetical protein
MFLLLFRDLTGASCTIGSPLWDQIMRQQTLLSYGWSRNQGICAWSDKSSGKVSRRCLRLQQRCSLFTMHYAKQFKEDINRSYLSGLMLLGSFVSNPLSQVPLILHAGFSIWGADSPNGRPGALELLTVEEAKHAIETGCCFSRNTKQIRTHGVQPVIFNQQTRYASPLFH